MPEMPMHEQMPEDMQEDKMSAEGEQPGGAVELVSNINDGLVQLLGGISRMKDIPDQVKQNLGSIVQAFQMFVKTDLGGKPGGQPPQKTPPGISTPEAGAAAVEPA